jgi:hypothetical protein
MAVAGMVVVEGAVEVVAVVPSGTLEQAEEVVLRVCPLSLPGQAI